MSGIGATPASGREPSDPEPDLELCVLLTCFAGRKRAADAHRHLDRLIARGGDEVLDHVVVSVNSKHKAHVSDPRRTLAGTLTPALTWGVFGLLAGGLQGLAVWAVVGAICGGLYAYLFEHVITKDELARVGCSLPADSSATLAFVRGSDPEKVLSAAASFEPTSATVAAITSSLSARIYGTPRPDHHATASAGTRSTTVSPSTDAAAAITLVLARFAGEHGARSALAGAGAVEAAAPGVPTVELIIEVGRQGHRRVIDPTNGSQALALPDALAWGAFGLVWGLIGGFTAGEGGVLGFIESDLVTGILWTVFGLAAGALYGLWAGRGVSARRLKRLGSLLHPDTSLVVAWANGATDDETIDRWTPTALQNLGLRFAPDPPGAVLKA